MLSDEERWRQWQQWDRMAGRWLGQFLTVFFVTLGVFLGVVFVGFILFVLFVMAVA